MDIADSMRVPVSEWENVIHGDYLSDYIPNGGSAVRFISGAEDLVDEVAESLTKRAASQGYHVARLDPARPGPDGKSPGYHQIDKLFFGISRTFNWSALAESHLLSKMKELGWVMPPGWKPGGDLSEFLRLNQLDWDPFVHEMKRAVQVDVVRDRAMTLEFRSAVSALASHLIVPDSHLPSTEEVVMRWLRGEKAQPGDAQVLKRYQIYGRINRSNARHMLVSLCHWVVKAGYLGTVVVFDFRPYEYFRLGRSALERQLLERLRVAIQQGVPTEQLQQLLCDESQREPEIAYGNQAYMHMVHILRAFLDEIEVFEKFILVVLTTDEYYDSERPRNYRNYDALHTRIANEVRGERANPEGILCHLKEDV